jgi:predicted ribosomally synthesized peptide with SipW-like signal peptide
MTTGEIVFLAMVIVVFLVFAATLAYYSQR